MDRHSARRRCYSATYVALVALILTNSVSAFAQTGSMLYVPLLQSSSAGELGLALSNPTLTDTTVVLTARSYTGAALTGDDITNPVTWNLPASSQKAQRAIEIFGTGITGQTGWVEIRSSDSAIRGFYLLFDSSVSYIDGAELPTSGTRTLVFPKVVTNPSTATNVTFVNVSGSTNQAAISLFDNGGSLVFYRTLTLDPRAGFSGPITELIPEIGLIAFEGYAVLETASATAATQLQSLVGFESYRNKSDIAVVTGVPSNEAMRKGYIAHMASGGGYRSSLTLVNYTAQSQAVRITAESLQRNGQALTPSAISVERTIDGFGRFETEVGQLFGLTNGELTTAYIRYEVLDNTSGLIGVLDYGTTDGILLAAVRAQAEGFSQLLFSQVAEGSGYYTGLAFLNPNNESSVVAIDVFSRDGQKTASAAVSLAAGERRSRLLTELAPGLQPQTDGYIQVTATRPVLAFELFGSSNSLRFLANVSALGSVMQPQASGRVVVAAAGATVISSDGTVALSIPPTAVNSNVAISLTPLDPTTLPTPPDRQLVAAVEAEPSGLTFRMPITLTLPLSMQFPAGTSLPVLLLNTSTNSFGPAGVDAVVDETGRNAVAKITHFSKYAIDVTNSKLLTVTSIAPRNGSPGTTVTITGSGFDPNPANNLVTFAGAANTAVPATVLSASATTLTVTVPATASSGDVIVTTGGRSSVGIRFVVPSSNSKPSISSLVPPSALVGAPSVDVLIQGTGFQSTSIVKFDGTVIASSFVDANQLSIRLSSAQLSPVIHQVTVSNPAPGGGNSNEIEFPVMYPLPIITNLTPNNAIAGSTATVTITGNGFTNNSTVFVNGVIKTSTFVDATTMTVAVTSAVSGIIPVSVSNPAPGGGLSNAADFAFTKSSNGRPVVTATASPSVTMPAAATLSGTATDDGVPGPLTSTWRKVSGVGNVTFQNPNALNTTATFSAGGVYVLRLTGSDTLLTATADVTVRVMGSIPPVTISNPLAGFVRSTVSVAVSTVSDAGLANVQFKLDGSNLGAAVTGAGPYATPWNTSGVADGSQHTLSATATDAAGNQTVAPNVVVRVDNTPPTVGITAPTASAKLRGAVSITTNTSDAGSSVARVQFRIDGNNLGTPVTSAPFELSWNTAQTPDGTHTLTAVATDAAGNQATSTGIQVSIDNTAPSGVAITAPAANAAVSGGSVALRSDGSDTVGIVKVEFRVDNNLVGVDTTNRTQPFSVSWNSATVVDGTHSVTATAFDAMGNQTTSAAVSFFVANAVVLTSPTVNQVVKQMVNVSAAVPSGIQRVEFRLDNNILGNGTQSSPTGFTYSWNSASVPDGTHTLQAIATTSTNSLIQSGTVSFSVKNGAVVPSIASVSPMTGNYVRGNVVSLTATTADPTASVASVQFRVNGNNIGSPVPATNGNCPCTLVWNTTAVPDGTGALTAVAIDKLGNVSAASAAVNFVVDNTPPAVSLPAVPTATGVVTLSATASDASGIANVQFKVDGVMLSSDSTSPYTAAWDAGSAANGNHTLTATATDVAGNTATSAPVVTSVTSVTSSVRQYFASPTGSSAGNGSQSSPWDLATALCGGPNSRSCGGGAAQLVQPGDTIWLRGGTYYGTFSGRLAGASGNPITVRSYPGEWAKLDSYLTSPLANSPTSSSNDCTIRLNNAAGFTGNSVVHVGVEQMLLISFSGNSVTNCLRGYNGTPVVVHPAGEIVALSGHVLTADGTDVVYRDFEITDSNPMRTFFTRGDPSNQRGGEGILVNASRTKFINLVIHDAQDGIFLATSAQDTEVSGVILFNNGHVDPVRGHGHGLYIQNQNGSKIIKDVISLNNYATGMKAFGVNAYANNVEFYGVISFNNGSPGSYVGTPALAEPANPNSGPISPTLRETNLYVGTEVNPPQNIVMMNNSLYHSANTLVGSGTMGLGYTSVGANNFRIQNNYVIGGHVALFIAGVQNSSITNNVFLSRPRPSTPTEGMLVMAGLDQNPGSVDFSNNTYYDLNAAVPFRTSFSMISRAIPNCCKNRLGGGLLAFSDAQSGISGNSSGSGWVQWTGYDKTSSFIEGSLPTNNVVVVRPNQYEAGRANIAIYNWQNQATVSVDISSAGFVDGDQFEVRDVQNYFGAPVMTGIYAASNPIVQIPMGDSNSAVARPVGAPFTPAHTDREFGAFVVKKR